MNLKRNIARMPALRGAAWLALSMTCLVSGPLQAQEELTEDDIRWRESIGFNPLVHGGDESGAVTPERVPGLRLWLDAAEGVETDAQGRVARWQDRSGSGHDLTQVAAGSRPELIENAIHGRPALRMDGNQTRGMGLGHSEVRLEGQPGTLTILAVYRVNTGHAGGKILCYGSGFGNRHVLLGEPFDVDIDERFKSDVSGRYQAGQGYRVFTVRVDGPAGLVELWENGLPVRQLQRDPFAVYAAAPLKIGARDFGEAGNRWGSRADVAEVLLYNSALPDTDRAGLEAYLMEKYALSEADTRVNPLAASLPYAYYPGLRQIEVAFDATSFFRRLDAPMPENPADIQDLTIGIYRESDVSDPASPTSPVTGDPVVSLTMQLSGQGLGQEIFDIPDLPEGTYRVRYALGGRTLWSARRLLREHFDFEGNTYGLEHKVYPPFEPVQVNRFAVRVVDRIYALNALGGMDQVVSKGVRLLDDPVRVHAVTEDGRPIEFEPISIEGEALHPDLAVFRTRARSALIDLSAEIRIEEDGFAEVQLTYAPAEGHDSVRIGRMWLEMPMPDRSAPLCHLVGMDSMRYNYAGKIPKGGRITWHNQSWRPPRWTAEPFEGEAPAEYRVWESKDLWNHSRTTLTFAPYIWLGAAERGLAWAGDSRAGYIHDNRESLQQLFRDDAGERTILRVFLVQHPATLDHARTVTYALQASPTKPLQEDWRSYDVPGGSGLPVVIWGGYYCNDKYPDPKDWSLVEAIVAGRGSRQVDRSFFEELDSRRRWPDLKVHGERPWIDMVMFFAEKEANNPHPNGTTVYFEEHVTHPIKPEFLVFRDEWMDNDFSRYRTHANFPEGNYWGFGGRMRSANSPTYRDFVLHYADHWMRRGVGIYYDNTYPKIDRHPQRTKGESYIGSIWGHRAYYRRVWKRSREIMEQGLTPLDPLYVGTARERRMRLHVVGHVTNAQVLPYTTWWDASLGVEQPYQTPGGRALPFPPDYIRAMEMGRTAGLIPYHIYPLRGRDALGRFEGIGIDAGKMDRPDEEVRRHRQISDAAMGLVHEIRGGVDGYHNPAVGAIRRLINDFGYGKADVRVHNYWDESTPVQVDERVKTIALTREGQEPFGLALLQSYSPEAVVTPLAFAGATVLLDAQTRELILPAYDGTFEIGMAADYGTRLLLASRDRAAVARMAVGGAVLAREDFELGISPGWQTRGGAVRVAADSVRPGNRVLRVTAGHPSSNQMMGSMREADATVRLRVRVPAAEVNSGTHGVLEIKHQWNGRTFPHGVEQRLVLQVSPGEEAHPSISMFYEQLDGEARAGFQNMTVNTLGRQRPTVAGEWLELEIGKQDGTRRILLDGELVFEGEPTVAGGLELGINPGWHFERSGLPYVEVDDIEILGQNHD